MDGRHKEMSEDEVLENFFKNNDVEEFLNINESVMGYDPKDEAETCRFQRRDGSCFKGANCRKRHVPLSRGKSNYIKPV